MQSCPTVKRLPPLETLVGLKALITAIPPATAQRLASRRQAVSALAFDKLALTNANADTITAKFPFHSKFDRHALLHAIASSTPPPTLPGLDPDYAHEHLLDQHLLILYLLALSLICANETSSSDHTSNPIVTAKHPVLDQYCSATLLPTHYIHQALACLYLDLGLLAQFDYAFPFARIQANPVLFEYFVWALAFDAGFLDARDGSLISWVQLAADGQSGNAADLEEKVVVARNTLVLCHARGELPPQLTMSVCLTWNVNDAVKAAINDPDNNITPLLAFMSAKDASSPIPGHHHLSLLTNKAHFLLAPKNGTQLRNDLVSWCLCHVLTPPGNGKNALIHVPDLVFHLFANTIDYPRAVYTHYRIKQIKKHNNVPESPMDADREIKVKFDLMAKMQVTHVAELKMFMAQGVPGERAWLIHEGLEHCLYTNANTSAASSGMIGLKLAASIKRAAPVAEWARASTLELDEHQKPIPVRESSSNASDATVALPEALLLGGSMDTGDLIRDAPLASPERPVKKIRSAAPPVSPIRGSMRGNKEHHQADEADMPESDGMDVDADADAEVGQISFVYSDQVMELQTSQSPIRSPFSTVATPAPVEPTPRRPVSVSAAFTPTTITSASTPSGLTASQVSTPTAASTSLVRDPFTPTFALPRTPSTSANDPSTTPPSVVAPHSILHTTPKRDGTPRTPSYFALTPADAAAAIMSRRSRRSNPTSATVPHQQQGVSRPGSPGAQSPSRSSRVSAPAASRAVTPFKSRLSNTATAAASEAGESSVPPPALTTDDVIMATFAHNKEHQDLIMNQPIAESSAVWENEPAAPSSPPTMDIDRPTTPEPAPAAPPTSAPATPFDSEPTIRAPVDLPTFDYAQFHKVHVHGSPAADTQTLIETGQSAVERAQEMVRKSQAAANARAASHVVPETPMAPRGVASATPSTVGSDTLTPATPTVRPGRVPERQHQAVDSHVASTPEHTRRVRDAGHTPAPHPRGAKPVAAAANARTPYATQQTPKRTTRAAAAAAAAAASTPASPGPAPYNFRHKPVAATVAPDAHVSPARPAVTRRNVKRTASQVDTSAVVSPAKTPKRTGTAAAAADTTPKPAANARGTRVGLRSAGATSLTGEAAEQQGPGSPSSRAAGAAGGRATRRATLGAAGAAVVAAVGSRRATLGQQQEVGVGAAGSRPKRAATAGKKK